MHSKWQEVSQIINYSKKSFQKLVEDIKVAQKDLHKDFEFKKQKVFSEYLKNQTEKKSTLRLDAYNELLKMAGAEAENVKREL